MTCPRMNLILRLVSNDLSATDKLAIRQHLEACPTCQAAYVELQETWNVMETWKLEPPQRDLVPTIAQRLNKDQQWVLSPPFRVLRQPMLMRAAAVVALSVAAGIAAGLLTPGEVLHGRRQAVTAASPTEAVQALGLSEFGASSATGLPLSLEGKASKTQEEPS